IAGDLGLVGAPDSSATTAGAVHIYNLTTGVKVRTLTPAPGDSAVGDQFGCSVAVSGNRVLIGSRLNDSVRGCAYVFDLKTGTQLAKLLDSSGVANDYFGTAVAMDGHLGIVSGTDAEGTKGVVVLYDLTNYTQILRYVPAGAVAGTYTGSRIDIANGKIFASGEGSPNPGKVFVYDLTTEVERVLQPSDSAASDRFGQSISASQGMVLIGGNSNGGAAYLFDLSSASSTEIKRLGKPDGLTISGHGEGVALVGNTAVVTNPNDNTQATNAGAVFIYRNLTRPMPLAKVTAKGDYAPGAVDISFNAFSNVLQSADGELAFTSSLTGAGSGGNKDTGVWDTLSGNGYLELIGKSRLNNAGTLVNVSNVLNNDGLNVYFQATMTFPAPNDKIIYRDNGTTVSVARWTANFEGAFPAAGVAQAGAFPASFLRVVQGRSTTNPYLSITCTLRNGIGFTSATTDSGLLIRNTSTDTDDAEREGALAGATGLTHGQFSDQLANYQDIIAYTTAVTGATATNQAIFAKVGFADPTLAAQKGTAIKDGGAVAV
ncbi:MAG: DUF7453 family protein, partial [Verrucomicrobiaceae bacterium]